MFAEAKPVAWSGDRRHWQKALAGPQPPGAAYLPLLMDHRVLGVLYLQPLADREVPAQERRVVESLANHAAVALERDRLTRSATAAQALAEADRLKTALLSMVSHDFRSPLASIKASVTGLLQEGKPWEPETQRELLQGIDHETDRLNRMVGSILALSRLEARMRGLVIDDEPQIRRALRAGLERNGYTVSLAASGEEGLDQAALQPPDPVILDLAMPGMDGFEVCRQSSRSARAKRTRSGRWIWERTTI